MSYTVAHAAREGHRSITAFGRFGEPMATPRVLFRSLRFRSARSHTRATPSTRSLPFRPAGPLQTQLRPSFSWRLGVGVASERRAAHTAHQKGCQLPAADRIRVHQPNPQIGCVAMWHGNVTLWTPTFSCCPGRASQAAGPPPVLPQTHWGVETVVTINCRAFAVAQTQHRRRRGYPLSVATS